MGDNVNQAVDAGAAQSAEAAAVGARIAGRENLFRPSGDSAQSKTVHDQASQRDVSAPASAAERQNLFASSEGGHAPESVSTETAGHEAPQSAANSGEAAKSHDGDRHAAHQTDDSHSKQHGLRDDIFTAGERLGALGGVIKAMEPGKVSTVLGKFADAAGRSRLPDGVVRSIWSVTDKAQGAALRSTSLARGAEVGSSNLFKTLEVANAVAKGSEAYEQAKADGTSDPAAWAAAFAATAIEKAVPSTALDKALGGVNAVTSFVSPEAGKYTGFLADMAPKKVLLHGVVGSIHTADAAIRGDGNQMIRGHEQNLEGKHGQFFQSLAVGSEAVIRYAANDSRGINQLTDALDKGRLGAVPQAIGNFGDWVARKAHGL